MTFIRSLILFKEEHRYGYKYKDTGEIVIPPIYENGKEYTIVIRNRNYLAVKHQYKWGLIDTENETVIDFRFDDIGRPKLDKGSPQFVMCFQQKGEGYNKVGIISAELKLTVPAKLDRFPENITVLDENTCWYYIRQGEKWGAVKSDGSVLMDTNYRKEEVTSHITALCKDLIMEYQIRQDDSNWLKKAMLSRTYSDLFEWNSFGGHR